MLFVAVAFVDPLFTKNLMTVATLVPRCLRTKRSTLEPSAPAVKIVATVPVPSLAVLAEVPEVTQLDLTDLLNIGVVPAAITTFHSAEQSRC